MRIAIAGVTGPVGRILVPELLAAGHTLVLLGREKSRLTHEYPGCICGELNSVDLLRGCDRLINLAAMNTDKVGDLATFRTVNEHLALELAAAAEQAGVREYVFISSVHALQSANMSHYAVSKRLGHAAIVAYTSKTRLKSLTLYFGAVTGQSFRGRLATLERLPTLLKRPAFELLRCIRPTTHPLDIVRCLGDPELLRRNPDGEKIITDGQGANKAFSFTTRTFELLFSVMLTPFAIFVSLLLVAIIRLESKGPAIFAQTRIGRYGHPFTCYKFRTMHMHTPETGTHEVSRAAVTRVGGFLRRTKLDELPQLVNVILGQMSIVGPRPCLPNQKELVTERARRGVFASRPGITGLSQVNGIDMSDPQRLARSDADYLALRTLPLDLRILVRTARGGGRGDRTRL